MNPAGLPCGRFGFLLHKRSRDAEFRSSKSSPLQHHIHPLHFAFFNFQFNFFNSLSHSRRQLGWTTNPRPSLALDLVKDPSGANGIFFKIHYQSNSIVLILDLQRNFPGCRWLATVDTSVGRSDRQTALGIRCRKWCFFRCWFLRFEIFRPCSRLRLT